jgi:hypothetical protein
MYFLIAISNVTVCIFKEEQNYVLNDSNCILSFVGLCSLLIYRMALFMQIAYMLQH